MNRLLLCLSLAISLLFLYTKYPTSNTDSKEEKIQSFTAKSDENYIQKNIKNDIAINKNDHDLEIEIENYKSSADKDLFLAMNCIQFDGQEHYNSTHIGDNTYVYIDDDQEIFNQCKSRKYKNIHEMYNDHEERSKQGIYFSEYILARVFTIERTDSLNWMMKASTWDMDSLNFIFTHLEEIKINARQKAFYFSLYKELSGGEEIYWTTENYLDNYTHEDKEEIIRSSRLFLNSSIEEKRNIINSLILP